VHLAGIRAIRPRLCNRRRDAANVTERQVLNRARGGRSSRTFITEGLWDQLLADVKRGDIVLIQFGHNDAGAITDLRLSRPQAALADLDRALALAPGHAGDLLSRRGYVHLLIGEPQAAAADLDQAIDAGDRRTSNYLNRSQARLRLGDRAGAVADLREALRREPGSTAARSALLSLGETP